MEQRRPQPREPVVELQRHRRCVETVGRRGRGYLGARHDWWRTATLSYKCFAAAFRNVFVREREAPLELPTSIAAYRSQQTRWFKGFGQPFAKKAADAFTSSNTPVVHKVVFFFHTLPSLCYADTVMFQLYFWPAVFVSVPFSWAWLGVNLGALAMFWAFYSLTLYRALGFWRGLAAQWRIAEVMVLCWGMAPLLATAPVQGTSSSDATVFFFMDYADAQAGRHRGRRIIVARRAQRAGRVGFDHPLGAGRHPGTAAGGSGGARGHDDGDGDGCGVGGGG